MQRFSIDFIFVGAELEKIKKEIYTSSVSMCCLRGEMDITPVFETGIGGSNPSGDAECVEERENCFSRERDENAGACASSNEHGEAVTSPRSATALQEAREKSLRRRRMR